jgi:prepilin-type N-terminal cleavage/methylation domain-containing protein
VTLTELLVALALVGVLATATLQLLDQSLRAWAAGVARVESQQTVRVVLTRLAADIRAAGFGGVGFDAIAVAEPQRIVLQQDLDGDGAIAASGERVTWRLAGSILRRDAGGGAQPIASGVRVFELRYLDAIGAPSSTPADVRSISVTVTTASERAMLSAPTSTLSTLVRLRNR